MIKSIYTLIEIENTINNTIDLIPKCYLKRNRLIDQYYISGYIQCIDNILKSFKLEA